MNLLKQEKGSITLFVLISMIFFVVYLVGMYMLSANAESIGVAESSRIKEIYEQDVDNIDDVYETLTSRLTLSEKITAENYGDYVNYPVNIDFPNVDMQDLGHKTDWRIFYKDDDGYVYLTTSYYLPYSEMPSGMNLQPYTGRPYTAYWLSAPTLMQDTTNYGLFRPSISGVTISYSLNSNYTNSIAISELVNTSNWDNFVNKTYADYAIGAPTLEMWVASWNAKGYTKLYCNNTREQGYYVGTSSSPTSYFVSELSTSDSLYFPVTSSTKSDSKGYHYWLASPSAYDRDCLIDVSSNGKVNYDGYYNYNCYSARPVVRLKATVGGKKDENGVWQLSNATNIKVTAESSKIKLGQTTKVTAGMPVDMADAVVTYSSTNENVAIVSNDGIVTGIGNGTTTITITAKNEKGQEVTGNCKIVVYQDWTDITAANYGDYVNYPVDIDFPNVDMQALGHKTDWRIFYKDDDGYVYLTTSYLLPYSLVPSGVGMSAHSEKPYSAYWSNVPSMQDITNYGLFRPNITGVTIGYSLNSSYQNSRCVSALANTSNWDNFANKTYADYAIGAPTLEMWIASWNAKGNTKLYCNNTDSYGYYIGTESSPTSHSVSGLSTNDSLYFPVTSSTASDSNGYSYWLASPSATINYHLMYVSYDSLVSRYTLDGVNLSARPLVRLKDTTTGEKINGIWQLQ